MKMLRNGSISGVAFWSLDRWGRTMTELILEMEEFRDSGKQLISMREALDLGTAAGRLAAYIIAAMANFERDRIQERTLLGLARAKAQGKILGRPKGKKDSKKRRKVGYYRRWEQKRKKPSPENKGGLIE